jgi:hypothetical protein
VPENFQNECQRSGKLTQSVDEIRRALRANRNDKSRQQKELEGLLNQVGPGYWSYQIRRKLAQIERELQQQ